MTLLTTIRVATPSVTLTIEAKAMNLVRRYRQDKSNLYIANPLAVKLSIQIDTIGWSVV